MTGFLIRLLRQSHGLTAAELASRANVRLQVVEQAEAGTKEPTAANLQRIARALGVTVDDLIRRPAPGLDDMPEWRQLGEGLYQYGARVGWLGVQRFLVVMLHAWGREIAAINRASHARA